jgi:hypothetical protein
MQRTHPPTSCSKTGTPSTTDGPLAFRVRVDADSSPAGFKAAVFVGVDANADGALDLFIGVNNSGSADTIGIWNPGNGLSVNPTRPQLCRYRSSAKRPRPAWIIIERGSIPQSTQPWALRPTRWWRSNSTGDSPRALRCSGDGNRAGSSPNLPQKTAAKIDRRGHRSVPFEFVPIQVI